MLSAPGEMRGAGQPRPSGRDGRAGAAWAGATGVPRVAPSLRSFLCTLRGPTPSGNHRCSETPVSTGEGRRPVPQAWALSQGTEPAGRWLLRRSVPPEAGSGGCASCCRGGGPARPQLVPGSGSSEREAPACLLGTDQHGGRIRQETQRMCLLLFRDAIQRKGALPHHALQLLAQAGELQAGPHSRSSAQISPPASYKLCPPMPERASRSDSTRTVFHGLPLPRHAKTVAERNFQNLLLPTPSSLHMSPSSSRCGSCGAGGRWWHFLPGDESGAAFGW